MGRFTTCDPLFEKYYGWSPYVYSGNNPVNLYDNNGKWWKWHHADMSESAAAGMGLTKHQIERLRAGTIVVDDRQKDEQQFWHCMVSKADVKNYGYEQAVKNGKEKLKEQYNNLKAKFLSSSDDEAFYYLGQILHSIQDAMCPEHQWKIYDSNSWWGILMHTIGEGRRGDFRFKDYYDGINITEKEIEKLFKERAEYRKRNAIGTEIGNSAGYWFLGTPFYTGSE